MEHTPNYSYQNLYTYITTLYPSGKVLQQQLNIDLADKAGNGTPNAILKIVAYK
ncbi:MAG: gliding motility lipoprotein GldH [Saprospiraceae bacterium]|nr:gliding motility lipoprotein GldH [Saprospiraceae bacterium]